MATDSPAFRRLWIGTFPVAGIGTPAGRGEGIWLTRIDLASGRLSPAVQACRTPAPSFLARVPGRDVLHATGEASPEGVVTTWTVEGDALRPLSSIPSLGDSPTHVAVARGLLLACNYGDGTVLAAGLDEGGLPRRPARALRHGGGGPVLSRQEGSHAHSATFTPDGATALVCDLGTDELRRLRLGPPARPGAREDGVAFRFRPGSGPRHAAFRRGGRVLDVVTELSAELVTLTWDGRSAAETARRPAQVTTLGQEDLPSHVTPSADGKLLYVGNRGPGTISVFALPDPAGGAALAGPAPLGEVSAGSAWPRHLAVVPGLGGREFIVVAGERAGRLHVLARDAAEALPRLLPEAFGTPVPSPAFVLPG
jgi:6-phosphogluconolactonase (cycloisomerase 2 family)